MAYDERNVKYPTETHQHHRQTPNYRYPAHQPLTDENRNENNCGNKETRSSMGAQPVQKVDASTMTEPLQIDFRLTSEYLARCSGSLGLPYVSKYEENGDASSQNCQDRPKMEYDTMPCNINGILMYSCPECAYRFTDRDSLQEHLDDHRQRPHICDICGTSLKRKEHLDRHKQGHNKDRPYQCTMCCKAFKRNEHLARHMVTHSGRKNQICTECGKAFYRKDHLKKHLQSHNGARKSAQNSPNGEQAPMSEYPTTDAAAIVRPTGTSLFSSLRT